MSRQRIQVSTDIAQPRIATPAAPVDTFVQPTDGLNLQRLAKGLATLEPSLGQLSDVITQRENKSNYEAGTAKAAELYANFQDVTKAMKAGEIQANQNPWFMAGLREQFGRVAADRMNFEMLAAMNTDETLQTSTDVKDFDQFAQGFVSNWEKSNLGDGPRDANFERGFAAKTDAYIADTQRQWASQLDGRARNQMNAAHYAEVASTITNELRRGTGFDAIANEIDTLAGGRIRLGANGGQINRTTVAAVIGTAEDLASHGDDRAFQVLDMLKSIPGGPQGVGSLAQQSFGQPAYVQTVDRIGGLLQNYQTRVSQAEERKTKQRINDVWSNMITQSAANPNYDIQGDLEQIGMLDRTSVVGTKSAWDAIFSDTYKTDERVYANLFNAIWNDPDRSMVTPATIASALQSRKLTRQAAADLIGEWKRAHESGAEMILNEQPIQEGIRTLTATLTAQAGGEHLMTQEDAERLNQYSARVKSAYITYRQTDGQGATYIQRMDTVKKLVQQAFDTMQQEQNGVPNVAPAGASRTPSSATKETSSAVTPEERQVLMNDLVLNRQWTPAVLHILSTHGIADNPAAIQAFLQPIVQQH